MLRVLFVNLIEFFIMKDNKKIIAAGSVAAGSLMVVDSANAALNAGVATAFTGLQDDVLDLIDLAWPVAIAVTVAFIILGLFKKAANKAV